MDTLPFLLNITEALVSGLENDEEKSVAQLWIEKIKDLRDLQQQLKYLKIMILCMQKNILKTLGQSVPENPQKMMETLENASNLSTINGHSSGSPGKFGKIYTTTSGDLHEYFALQEIDDTFLHGYYAISSDEPLFKNLLETANFDMILNDKTFIIDEIDDLLIREPSPMESVSLDDKVNELCKCRNRGEPRVSIESRPTWGRNRFIERLIDQSPHTTGDLEVPEVDAMLHNLRNSRNY